MLTTTYDRISTIGLDHTANEDSYNIIENDTFFIACIADGIGGLPQGDLASQIAVDTFDRSLHSETLLPEIVHQINTKIITESKKRHYLMATTLSSIILNKQTFKATICSIGDTRVYIYNDTWWRTKDHTLVQELVDMQILTNDQAFQHTMKHRLQKALGMNEQITFDTYQKDVRSGYILLSSDGLHDYVEDAVIYDVVLHNSLNNICKQLERLARQNGSRDDITIIIVQLQK